MSLFQKLPLLSLFLLVLVSCSDETTVYEQPENNIGIESNRESLSNSVIFDNSGVLDIFERDILTGKSAKFANDIAGDYPLTLVASISPPSFLNGNTPTATAVNVSGNYAYVSYNTVGDDYEGAIDIIDISNPMAPVLTDRAYTADKDLNDIHYDNGYLYVAGGMDAEQSALTTDNSVIFKVAVSNGRFDTSDISYNYQPGFNATDVELMSNSIFVTSGKDGFISEYDKNSLSLTREAPFSDLRSLALNNGNIAVLDGGVGVRLLNSDFSEKFQIPINTNFGEGDKRTLTFSNDKIVVSEGEKGAGVYNAITGNLIEYIPILTDPSNVADSDIVTNAVALNGNVLLMANGGAGLSISEKNDSLDPVGIIELEGSINYVATDGDYVFAASGKKGLQIIKLNRPSESLVTKCEQLPEYEDSADLYVEGATNLALNKPVIQSSTYRTANASLAVDGNTNGINIPDYSISHTGNNQNAWWRVDLGASYDIGMIRVFNRTDCCATRLNNTEVYVGEFPSDNPLDYTKIGDLNSEALHRFVTTAKGRYVFIRKTDRNFLSLAEVEVYEHPEGTEQVAFKGSKRLKTLDVNGNLLLCGVWTVVEDVKIEKNALFQLNGILAVASNSSRNNLIVGEGATFRLEGDMTIWGDLILEDNATLEFIGNSNSVMVHGNVVKAESSNIRGSFDDTQGKF